MRSWIITFIRDVLVAFYDKVIRPDVRFCPHGYIAATCELCLRRDS